MAPNQHTLADGPDAPRLAAIGELLARGLRRLDIMRRRGNPDGRAAPRERHREGMRSGLGTTARMRDETAEECINGRAGGCVQINRQPRTTAPDRSGVR
jgi:hypothetical protein